MPRRAKGLTAAKVKTAGPGRYGDGNGLYLVVQPEKSRQWVFRWVRPDSTGKRKMREMGLGTAAGEAAVSLADARDRAAALIKMVRAGLDPLSEREAQAKAETAERQAAAIRALSFKTATERYLEAHEAGWSAKTQGSWANTLRDYAHPHFGEISVAEIDTAHVLAALELIWRVKSETAGRVRFRIEAVLDYAKVRGWRSGENPARWRGHLDHLLPAQSQVAPVEHFPALHYRELGAFMIELRKREEVSVQALEFLILTAARTAAVLDARWGEINRIERTWTVPAEKMKGRRGQKRELVVPLSPEVLRLLDRAAMLRIDEGDAAVIFPGARLSKGLSGMALEMTLRRMNPHSEERTARWRDPRNGRPITPHGFRSTFKDWATELTNFPPEVAEMALGHVVGDKVEAAYRRGDLLRKRRQLMDAWASFCATSV